MIRFNNFYNEFYNGYRCEEFTALLSFTHSKLAEDILVFIKESADLDPEGQSLYRSLRRLEKSTLVQSQKVASPGGPDKKRFTLTAAGKNVLDAFIERNINRIIIQGYKDGLFDLER